MSCRNCADVTVNMKMADFFTEHSLPSQHDLLELVNHTIVVLNSEPQELRPKDSSNLPGALLHMGIFLKTPIPAILVPDLHARIDFFTEILNFKLPQDISPNKDLLVKDALAQGKLFLICLGDGFHGERRVVKRWLESQKEWLKGNIFSKAMGEEMSESLSLMMMVMETKCAYPNYFHFLKGNHENILNELGRGNYPFRKFASEGKMVAQFMQGLYGKPLVKRYAEFEHRLPLFVYGTNFLASHAEPIMPFSQKQLINGLLDGKIIRGLTWTNNDEAQENSVENMLNVFLPKKTDALYFAGHRSIPSLYRLLKNGKFIQIHNPEKHLISLIRPNRSFNPDTDIYDTCLGEIPQKIEETINA